MVHDFHLVMLRCLCAWLSVLLWCCLAKALILVLVQRLPVVVLVYCVHPNLSKALCLMAALPLCTLCTSSLAVD